MNRQFSLRDVVAGAATRKDNASLDAVRDHTARVRATGFDVQGLVVPWVALERAGLTTANIADQVEPVEFSPLLRNLSVLGRAGATFRPLQGHSAGAPVQTGTATAAWVSENPGSDVSRSNLTTSLVSLAFKTCQATTSVSRQAVISAQGGSFNLEEIIRQDLMAVIALAIDLAGLNGSGTSGQPLGLLQDTAVSTVALGTNGAAIDRTACATLEKNVAAANADRPGAQLAFATTPGVRFKARTTPDIGGTAGSVPLWTDGNRMIGYPAYSSNQIPANYTKGTSTTVCSGVIFGAFEHLLIGTFGGGIDVVIDPFTSKNQNMIDITVRGFVDIANRRPAAFQLVKDALVT